MSVTEQDHEDSVERAHETGSRQAWTAMLQECVGRLGLKGETFEALALQRSELVTALRSVCRDFGDNSWAEDMNLADVVEKYLERQLNERDRVAAQGVERMVDAGDELMGALVALSSRGTDSERESVRVLLARWRAACAPGSVRVG